MKALGIATLAVLALSSTANAADLPVKAPPPAAPAPLSWTGFYIGGNAGYAWGTSDVSSVATCPTGGFSCVYPSTAVILDAFGAGASGALKPNGFTGGAQVGYNWQTGNVVYGIEADFNAFSVKGSVGTTALVPTGAGQSFTSSATVSTDWLFTFRGRLGWAVTPSVLLYATGGLAVTQVKVANSFSDNCAVFCQTNGGNTIGASSKSSTEASWTLGAGVEWLLARNWSAKVEYLYADFGSVSTTLLTSNAGLPGFPPNVMKTSADLTVNIVRAGINYRF